MSARARVCVCVCVCVCSCVLVCVGRYVCDDLYRDRPIVNIKYNNSYNDDDS